MAYYKKPKRKAGHVKTDPEHLSKVLFGVCQHLALEEKVKEWSVLSLWTTLVSEPFTHCTQAARIKKSPTGTCTLWVYAKDTHTAAALGFKTTELLKQLNQYAPQTTIKLTHIKIQVKPDAF